MKLKEDFEIVEMKRLSDVIRKTAKGEIMMISNEIIERFKYSRAYYCILYSYLQGFLLRK